MLAGFTQEALVWEDGADIGRRCQQRGAGPGGWEWQPRGEK